MLRLLTLALATLCALPAGARQARVLATCTLEIFDSATATARGFTAGTEELTGGKRVGAGKTAKDLAYDPWGKVRNVPPFVTPQPGNNQTGYTSHNNDPEFGYVYAQQRYFKPDWGWFLSQDPVMGSPYAPNTLHPFNYVGGNPTRYTDPDGRAEAETMLLLSGRCTSDSDANAPECAAPRAVARAALSGTESGRQNLAVLAPPTTREGIGAVEEACLSIPGAVGCENVTQCAPEVEGHQQLSGTNGCKVKQLQDGWRARKAREAKVLLAAIDATATPGGAVSLMLGGARRGPEKFAEQANGLNTVMAAVVVVKSIALPPQGLKGERKRDPVTGQFAVDPNNPPSPNTFTDGQRRAAWKSLAEDPNSPLTDAQRSEIKNRGYRGPQRLNDYGEIETMELSHEPVPLRQAGTVVVPRWPADHAAVDPHRQLKKRP